MKAFNKARKMMNRVGIEVDSVRLDRYYTFKIIIKRCDNQTKFYILPKKNTKINGKIKCHDIWKSLMEDSMVFLKGIYRQVALLYFHFMTKDILPLALKMVWF